MLTRHCEAIAAALRGDGCWWADAVLPPAVVAALRADLHAHRHALTEAAIGRSDNRQLAPTVRADLTLWLNGDSAPQRDLLAALEQLRVALNQRLLLGLFDIEAHYALYPPGAGYERHFDAFRDTDARVLSTVFYLNDEWREGDGGELRLWRRDGTELATLAPRAGRAVMFLSEEFPHAVLPARRDRLSIAGWLRRREWPVPP